MAEITERRGFVATHERTRDSSYQAYKLLHLAFILAPTLAGLDKFFHVLVDWNQYLSPQVMNLLPISGSQFMDSAKRFAVGGGGNRGAEALQRF